MHYEFFIEGEPVAQSRPRFSTRNGYVMAHDMKKSSDYKDIVYDKAFEEFEKHGRQMLTGALELRMIVYKPIPKSWSKKKKNMARCGYIYPTSKPDLDNYIKIVLDGIGRKGRPKIIFNNDSQFTSIYAVKKYADDSPWSNFNKVGIRIILREWQDYRDEERRSI